MKRYKAAILILIVILIVLIVIIGVLTDPKERIISERNVAAKPLEQLEDGEKVLKIMESSDVKSGVETGEWFFHKGDTIAIVVSKSPTKVFVSRDGGETWSVSEVAGTDRGYHLGRLMENMEYANSYIGFNEDGSGYLVLTTGLALGSQDARIFLTQDSGETWGEIKNLNDINRFLVTGAGYSPEEIVFVSFRYYMDSGPDIWYSEDRGESWQRLLVKIPEEYSEYRFDAQSPSFDGLKGTYPLAFYHEAGGKDEKGIVNLVSDDGGRTWEFES